MKIFTLTSAMGLVMLAGCFSSMQGIKMRAQSPSIEEAFRKLSLAISVDGYQAQEVNPSAFTLESAWRPLKDKELSPSDLGLPPGAVESKVMLRCEKRGALYDVFLTPMLRYHEGGKNRDVPADVRHPLWEKWQKALTSLIAKEFKEED